MTDRSRSLAVTARGLFPPWVSIAASDPKAPAGVLYPAESLGMARAVEGRRREFAAGRCAARQAMAALDLPPCAVPAGADRAPIWPAGVVGSISHSDSVCLAVVARVADARAIGVDVEPALPLARDDWNAVSVSEERLWLSGQPGDKADLLARLVFSAKECAYKCQYTLTRRSLEFGAMSIAVDEETGSFCTRFREPAGEFRVGDCLPGRFVFVQSMIITAMALAAPMPTSTWWRSPR